MYGILPIFVAALLASASCAPVSNSNTLVVAVGSSVSGGDYVTYVDTINLVTGNSHKQGTTPPITLNSFGSAAAQNGTIFFVGGTQHGTDSQSSFLSYDARGDKWTTLPPFPLAIQQSAVAVVGTQLLSLGGLPVTGQITDVYSLDLAAQSNQTWMKLPTQLPTSSFPVCAMVNNRTLTLYLLVENGDLFRSSDAGQSWTQLKSISSGGRQSVACAALEDVIVVAGGDNVQSGSLALGSVYDIAKNEWHDTAPMSKSRNSAQAVAIPYAQKAVVVVCGGFDSDGDVYSDCEQLDVSASSWSPAEFNLNAALTFFGLFATSFD